MRIARVMLVLFFAVSLFGQTAQKGQPGEAFFNSGAASNFGAQFANKIAVKCP